MRWSIGRGIAIGLLWGSMLLCCGGAGAPPEAGFAPVDARMAESAGLLREGETGSELRRVQKSILDGLDALIEAVGQSTGAPQVGRGRPGEAGRLTAGTATGPSGRPAEEDVAPRGTWEWSRRPPPSGQEGDWAPKLPDQQRRKVRETFRTGRLPARYRALLQQYNRRLAREPE